MGEIKKENTRLKRELASWTSSNNDDLTQLQIENGRLKSELKRLKNTVNDEVMEVMEVVEVESDNYKEELRKSNFVNMKLKSGKNS